jgi:hypothetical protein
MWSIASFRTARKIGSLGIIPFALVLGLLMAPVTCTCGASVPHGHSLFQLPHHHHGADDSHHDHHSEDYDHTSHQKTGFSHSPHPLMVDNPECDEPIHLLGNSGHFALSNALEHQDSAVIQPPPTSSFGQPMTIAQPPGISTPLERECDSIFLPATRTLQGVAISPEIPPPKA